MPAAQVSGPCGGKAAGAACLTGGVCTASGACVSCGGATSTFAIIQRAVFESEAHGCVDASCHGATPGQGGLDLRAEASFAGLVGTDAMLSNQKRVAPGEPGKSFLVEKMSAATRGTPVSVGEKMPTGGKSPVPERLLQGVTQWIAAGAPETGFAPGLENLCQAACSTNADCKPADSCAGALACQAGQCVTSKPVDCDDKNPCTADACDAKAGCTHEVTEGLVCQGGMCDAKGVCTKQASTSGQLTQAWDGPMKMSVTSKSLVVGDQVFVTSGDAGIYALDRNTGKQNWKIDTRANKVHAGAVLSPDGDIVVGDGDAVIWKITQRGQTVWKKSVREFPADHIWSSVTIMGNRIFVPIASYQDQPCTKGRVVALDLKTGNNLWRHQTVPNSVCSNDTSKECTTASQCGIAGGQCRPALGGSVTAEIAPSDDGKSVYVNTVGCYTSPSVGPETDAFIKLDASTGTTVWARKFTPNESFGKLAFADLGFLNGPIVVNTTTAAGVKVQILVSGSKNGTIYAVRADTGQPFWQTQISPTPSFAGFGAFNGALIEWNGKILAALNETGLRPAAKHFVAFNATDGKIAWSDEIGTSYSHVAVAGGVAYVGTNAANTLYTYNADTGKRIGAYPMPGNVAGRVAVDGDMVFAGYGTSGGGGLRAFRAK